MLFEVVFMETAGYIIVGAICERITFWAFLLCEIFVGAHPLPDLRLLGLGRRLDVAARLDMGLGHGYVDFAGSTVVHAVGGFCAMALAVILGPRLGKYGPDGKPRAFPAHNIVFVVTGTFILLFGWMGFNPGSTLGATDLRISVDRRQHESRGGRRLGSGDDLSGTCMFGKPDISMACNGMLAGLVAITAPCAFVGANSRGHHRHPRRRRRLRAACCSTSACSRSTTRAARSRSTDTAAGSGRWLRHLRRRHLRRRMERRRRGHLSRQGRQGVTGLLYGDTSQFICQLVGATLCVVWAFGVTFVVFKVVNAVQSMRVSPEVELEGLDVPEFGMPAIPKTWSSLPSPDPDEGHDACKVVVLRREPRRSARTFWRRVLHWLLHPTERQLER